MKNPKVNGIYVLRNRVSPLITKKKRRKKSDFLYRLKGKGLYKKRMPLSNIKDKFFKLI
jgi:hypothetical protein